MPTHWNSCNKSYACKASQRSCLLSVETNRHNSVCTSLITVLTVNPMRKGRKKRKQVLCHFGNAWCKIIFHGVGLKAMLKLKNDPRIA